MDEVACVCKNPRCRSLFYLPGFGHGQISFEDSVTQCPNCGSEARILDGTYLNLPGQSQRLIAGTPETYSAVNILKKIIADAKEGMAAEEIVQELESKSAVLGIVSRQIVARKGLVFLIAALSYILAACEAKLDMKLDWNVIADQLHVYATGKAPYPGLTEGKKPETPPAEPKDAAESSKASEPERTSSLQSPQSHHKSTLSKRQKRRNAKLCGRKLK